MDISVLILFFNRPEPLRAMFAEVRKARPARLFLYQDGARNEKDLPGIEACRRVVEEIDWECEVHRNYQTVNRGCDPSNYLSQKWAFSLTDKCVVLEDDDIPSVTFFRFCKEMLDKYENDPRIALVTGTNYDERTEGVPYDYFFATTFSINGWATWRRVIDQWDETYSWLDDDFNREQLAQYIKVKNYQQNFIDFCRYHRNKGVPYYETIFHAHIFFNSALCIVPTVNLVNNLGAVGEGVHLSGSNKTLPKAYRRIFEMKRYELNFPLRHPRYVIENVGYKERMFRIQAWGHPWLKVCRSVEELWLNLRYGNFKNIFKALSNRIGIWCGKKKFD